MSDVTIGIEFHESAQPKFKYWRDGKQTNGDVIVNTNDTMNLRFTKQNQGWNFAGCIITPTNGAPSDCVSSTTTPTEITVTDRNTNATNVDHVYDYQLAVVTDTGAFHADPKLINRPGG